MILFFSLLACIVVMSALWLRQRATARADWVDFGWAAMIGVQALIYAIFGDGAVEKRVLAVLIAATWSLRLAHHLFVRLSGHRTEDGRYQAMRDHWGTRADFGFFWFFLAQAVVAWLFALPAWVVASDPNGTLNGWVLAGLAFWLVSLTGESVADRQLSVFRANPDNRGKVCNVGFWRYSRHPNYFFEWLHWFAYPLVAMGAPAQWLAWLGPVIMLAFLYRVSGIPYTEQQALKSRGDAYREYQRTTSAFIPLPPRTGRG